MAYTSVTISPAPLGAYDPNNPTKNTELWCAQQHNMLQALTLVGPTIISDGVPTSTDLATMRDQLFVMVEEVFDYAALAISNFRTTGSPNISKPLTSSITTPWIFGYPEFQKILFRVQSECYKMMFKIYYMWETEEDPLRIKDYIRDMLIAWPLNDIEIQLNEEGGQSFRVYPVWKDADL